MVERSYENVLQEKQEIEATFEEMKLGVRNGGKAVISKEVGVNEQAKIAAVVLCLLVCVFIKGRVARPRSLK